MISVGDMAGFQLEDALFAATAGDIAGTDRALELALAEGATPVGALRAPHAFATAAGARASMEAGMTATEAARSARPPVYGARMSAFAGALGAMDVGRHGSRLHRGVGDGGCMQADRSAGGNFVPQCDSGIGSPGNRQGGGSAKD